jgi:hypothetical protein
MIFLYNISSALPGASIGSPDINWPDPRKKGHGLKPLSGTGQTYGYVHEGSYLGGLLKTRFALDPRDMSYWERFAYEKARFKRWQGFKRYGDPTKYEWPYRPPQVVRNAYRAFYDFGIDIVNSFPYLNLENCLIFLLTVYLLLRLYVFFRRKAYVKYRQRYFSRYLLGTPDWYVDDYLLYRKFPLFYFGGYLCVVVVVSLLLTQGVIEAAIVNLVALDYELYYTYINHRIPFDKGGPNLRRGSMHPISRNHFPKMIRLRFKP